MNELKKEIALKIACNVRMARVKRNMDKKKGEKISQTKLSELSGINRTTITRIENATHMPDVYTLVRIARALDVELTELLEGIK